MAYLPGGRPPRPGRSCVTPSLAATLRKIAADGPRSLLRRADRRDDGRLPARRWRLSCGERFRRPSRRLCRSGQHPLWRLHGLADSAKRPGRDGAAHAGDAGGARLRRRRSRTARAIITSSPRRRGSPSRCGTDAIADPEHADGRSRAVPRPRAGTHARGLVGGFPRRGARHHHAGRRRATPPTSRWSIAIGMRSR